MTDQELFAQGFALRLWHPQDKPVYKYFEEIFESDEEPVVLPYRGHFVYGLKHD